MLKWSVELRRLLAISLVAPDGVMLVMSACRDSILIFGSGVPVPIV